jgi:hypothetical protein
VTVSENVVPLIQQIDLLTFTLVSLSIIFVGSIIVNIAEIASDYTLKSDKMGRHARNTRKRK